MFFSSFFAVFPNILSFYQFSYYQYFLSKFLLIFPDISAKTDILILYSTISSGTQLGALHVTPIWHSEFYIAIPLSLYKITHTLLPHPPKKDTFPSQQKLRQGLNLMHNSKNKTCGREDEN